MNKRNQIFEKIKGNMMQRDLMGCSEDQQITQRIDNSRS